MDLGLTGYQAARWRRPALPKSCTSAIVKNQTNNMKSYKFIISGLLCSLGLALSAYGADTYKVDPVHSSVVFGIKHNGVTNFYGAFKEISG
jgi:polyisoprenoid-binding protein YceI